MFQKKCETCKIYIPQQQTCQLMPNFQGRIKPTDYCSQHKDFLYHCVYCGAALLDVFVRVEEDGSVHTICGNCVNRT